MSAYLHIWDDKRAGGDLYTHLYHKRCNGKTSRGRIKLGLAPVKKKAGW